RRVSGYLERGATLPEGEGGRSAAPFRQQAQDPLGRRPPRRQLAVISPSRATIGAAYHEGTKNTKENIVVPRRDPALGPQITSSCPSCLGVEHFLRGVPPPVLDRIGEFGWQGHVRDPPRRRVDHQRLPRPHREGPQEHHLGESSGVAV